MEDENSKTNSNQELADANRIKGSAKVQALPSDK